MLVNVEGIGKYQENLTYIQSESPLIGSTLAFVPKALVSMAQIVDGLAGAIVTGTVYSVSGGYVGGQHFNACLKEFGDGLGSLAVGTFNFLTLGIPLALMGKMP